MKPKPKVIHTRTFSYADDHPIVYYTFDDNNKAICEYCSAQFVYEPKKKLLPLTDHYIPGITDSPLTHIPSIGFIRQPGITESPTHSEEMQDELEPIKDDYVNKILKGSG